MTEPAPAAWEDVFFRRLEQALPVDDMLGWILAEFPTATEKQVLAMVQAICNREDRYRIEVAGEAERTYQVDGDAWGAFPQSVAFRGEAPLA